MVDPSSSPDDQPLAIQSGMNLRRERMWGILGGTLGALVGLGLALEAVYVEGSGWYSGASYPPFFATPRVLLYDFCLLSLLLVGTAFSASGIFFARFGRYPRTDACGASILGLVLTTLGGVILFLRLYAVVHGG